MRILFVLGREPEYSRNKVLLRALKSAGHTIIPCYSSRRSGILRFLVVLFKFMFLRWKKHDVLFVGFFGQHIVPLLKLYDFDAPLVFDAFLSAYDTMVFDRKIVARNSLRGRAFYFLDWASVRLADVVLLDTNEHIQYFARTFHVSASRFKRVFISADERLFRPKKKNRGEFNVEFHGGFIPLQGTEFIIGAARMLRHRDVRFTIIGAGQTFLQAKKQAAGLKNVRFLGAQPSAVVAKEVARCDVGLGIFGATAKARRVIPNKAFEILASGRALITADTPASRELLAHMRDAYLCRGASSLALAKAILSLKKNPRLRARLARAGRATFMQKASLNVISAQLNGILDELVRRD